MLAEARLALEKSVGDSSALPRRVPWLGTDKLCGDCDGF